jgi:hypothetical protein
MRPQSIIMFERLFLASLVLGALSVVLNYQDRADLAANDPGMRQLGLGSGFLFGLVIVSYAIYLLLWFLIARRASKAAKWILVVFTVLGVLSTLPALTGPWDAVFVLSLVVYALEILAVVYLFRPDAKTWFDGSGQADPATFD